MPKAFLLIDDDQDDRSLFSDALTVVDSSIIFSYAEDAEGGLSDLTNNKQIKPDLIFLDINLPLMNGWQCLVEIKKNNALKEIPVIMYSTSSHQRDKDIANELGALCFITKPDDYKVLQKILRAIITNFDNKDRLAEICKVAGNAKL